VVVGTTSPNQAARYLDDGSMTKSILWDPGEAGYAMVWLAKQVLDKQQVKEGTEIPTIAKIPSLQRNTITFWTRHRSDLLLDEFKGLVESSLFEKNDASG
jgi:hypothetical protein